MKLKGIAEFTPRAMLNALALIFSFFLVVHPASACRVMSRYVTPEMIQDGGKISGVFATLTAIVQDPAKPKGDTTPDANVDVGRYYLVSVRSTLNATGLDGKDIVIRAERQLLVCCICTIPYPKYKIGEESFFPFRTQDDGTYVYAFSK